MSPKPLARYAALYKFVDLCRSLDIAPAPLLRAAGLDTAGLGQPDLWVPAHHVAEVLELAAHESGCEDFGLRLASFRSLSNLGPLSLALRAQPDVAEALNLLMRYERMYNEAIHCRVDVRDGIATFTTRIDTGAAGPMPQARQLAVGVMFGVLTLFPGDEWRPLSVSFTQPAPSDEAPFVRMFRSAIHFGAAFDGITFRADDLAIANPASDPLLHPYVQGYLASVSPGPSPDVTRRVRDIIEALLPTGRCSADLVARSLGVDRRTVNRWLADEGSGFARLLDDTRAALASRLIANADNSVTEVSLMLGFSTPGNFSRWFKGRFGAPPLRWRSRPAA